MMMGTWGPIPPEAWHLADQAHGDHVKAAYRTTLRKLDDPAYFAHCCDQFSLAPNRREGLLDRLVAAAPQFFHPSKHIRPRIFFLDKTP